MSKSAVATPKTHNIRPLDDRVLVKPDEAETITAGGIVLPDAAKDKPTRGQVVAVGAGRLLKNGKRRAVAVKPGDTVIYGKYSGSDIRLNGEEMKIVREEDLLGRVE